MSVRKKLIVGNESNYIGPQGQYRYPTRVSIAEDIRPIYMCLF
jgi:hypothetical protein